MGLSRNAKPAGDAAVAEAEVGAQAHQAGADAGSSDADTSIAAAAAASKAEKKDPKGSGKFRAAKLKIRDLESKVMYPTTHSVLGPRTDWVRSQLAAGVLVEEE